MGLGRPIDSLFTCGGVRNTEGCCFYHRFNMPEGRAQNYEAGQCRRRAPVLELRPGDGPRTLWPKVRADASCGDHMTIEEATSGDV